MGPLLVPAALLAYFVGVFLAVVGTIQRSAAVRRGSMASLLVAWVLHLGAIVHHGIVAGRFPVSNLLEFLLVFGWVVLTLYLFVATRWHAQAVGAVLPPLAAFMAVPALWLPARRGDAPYPGKEFLFVFHTSVATAGLAALCVAFAMSVVYLVQDRALKSKRTPRLLTRLPSLETCDRIAHLAVLWGFPLLTLGIATGAVWSLDTHGVVWRGGAKQTFPILAWLMFAVLLYARLARGVGGRRSAYLTIAGFVLGALTIVGLTP